jgi:hypothetical protein
VRYETTAETLTQHRQPTLGRGPFAYIVLLFGLLVTVLRSITWPFQARVIISVGAPSSVGDDQGFANCAAREVLLDELLLDPASSHGGVARLLWLGRIKKVTVTCELWRERTADHPGMFLVVGTVA